MSEVREISRRAILGLPFEILTGSGGASVKSVMQFRGESLSGDFSGELV